MTDNRHEFRIVVETRWGSLLPQTVRASSLREALISAYALPLGRWFPPEEDADELPAGEPSSPSSG